MKDLLSGTTPDLCRDRRVEIMVHRLRDILLESVRRTETARACGLPYELQTIGVYSMFCRSRVITQVLSVMV